MIDENPKTQKEEKKENQEPAAKHPMRWQGNKHTTSTYDYTVATITYQ